MVEKKFKKGDYISIDNDPCGVGEIIQKLYKDRYSVRISVYSQGKEQKVDVPLDKKRLNKITTQK